MAEMIIYKEHDWVNGMKIATKGEDGNWSIFVGKRGGDMRKYKTIEAMDKEMKKRGFERQSI